MDTIFALASARGPASGVAIIRTSGPAAFESLQALTGKPLPPLRKAVLSTLKDPVSRGTVDTALILTFKAPHSFTGEDIVEYHVHGGPAVIQHLLDTLSRQPAHRMAEPGEFTRRAFQNGKMDLTEAEGLADLIHAETELQKAQALSQMNGALATLYDGWRDKLTRILAHVEADLEFPDEDLPEGILPKLTPEIETLANAINSHLSDNRRGERLRGGIKIAVIGAPNAGKSSLVNALTQREVAIVSALPGTTRDIIETHLDIGGYPVILSDTAGLRPEQLEESGPADTLSHDAIESEGIRRALTRAREADIKILLYDGTQEDIDPHTQALEDETALIVINKADENLRLNHPSNPLKSSAKTGSGFPEFLAALESKIAALIGKDESPALTRPRHRAALEDCRECLSRALTAPLPELAAEDLRLSIRALGRLTGRVDVEDLLDVIFRDFCIGK